MPGDCRLIEFLVNGVFKCTGSMLCSNSLAKSTKESMLWNGQSLFDRVTFSPKHIRFILK